MTTDRLVIPGLSASEQADVDEMWAQLERVQPRHGMRMAYVDGKKNVRAWSPVVPGNYLRLGNVLGWTGMAVQALTRRCNVASITWPDGDLADLGLPTLARQNRLMSTFSQAMQSSATLSTAFLVVTRGEEGEPPALLHAKTARNATGLWNPRTRSLRACMSVDERTAKGAPSKVSLYWYGVTVTASLIDGNRWVMGEPQEHVYGMPAMQMPYIPDLDRPFGRSRISREMMGVQDAAARSVCRLEGHMDSYSFPELWAIGVGADATVDDAGTTLEALAKRIGRIRGIPDDPDATPGLERADLKYFPAADPDAHLKALRAQGEIFSGLARIPLASLGFQNTTNPTSADSYIASREDLIAEAEGATMDWADPMSEALVKLAQVANDVADEDVPDSWLTIRPRFRSPLYLSAAAQADAGMKTMTAAPWLAETSVGLELLGLEPEQIERAHSERRRAQGRAAIAAMASLTTGTSPVEQASPTLDADVLKAKFDALGVAVRAGVSPESAASQLGMSGLVFTGATPVTLRLPEADAAKMEEA